MRKLKLITTLCFVIPLFVITSCCSEEQSYNKQVKQEYSLSSSENVCTDEGTAVSNRCQAITKKGTQCKRKAQKGSEYCWQHQK